MKNQKGSVGIVVLIVIAVVVVSGGYMLYQRNGDDTGTKEESTSVEGVGGTESSSISRLDSLAGVPFEEALQKAKEISLLIVKEESLGQVDCPEVSTDIFTSQNDGANKAWAVYVISENCRDDSIGAIREERLMMFDEESGWALRDAHASKQRCHVGRGHQDFSNELCN
ncbi:hypothetical protein CL629_04175 [bacterium]|nr:hypothetical protein [bacterium]|tara:strand:- start:3225 stop:3731 length:507 start_codon:yes stop_codon:yes gene_type:complete